MYALVIGASSEAVHAIETARNLSMKVLAFDGDKEAEALAYADESFVVDIREPENIYRILEEREISPSDMVIAPVPIGRVLMSAGALNEHYGLVGPDTASIDICTDKWLFHTTMKEHGLRNINCSLLKAGRTCDDLKVEYPVIVKPRFGAGSREVVCVSCDEEWKGFTESAPFDEDFIVEDAVQGVEYGVDGIVIDSRFNLVLVRRKIITKPPYRQCVGYIAVNEERESLLTERIRSFLEKLVKSCGLKDGVIHADIIDTGEELFVIEMSPRPSGHRLHDLFTPMVTGVDMVESFLKYAQTGVFEIAKDIKPEVYLIRYFDIESDIRRIPDSKYLFDKYPLVKYECNLKVGHSDVVKDGHSLMNRGYFVLKAETEEAVCVMADSLIEEFM